MREVTIFEAHTSYVLGMQFTHDSRSLISAGMDNLVRLWSIPDWKMMRTFEGHAHSVNSISLSPDEKTLASGSTEPDWSPQSQVTA